MQPVNTVFLSTNWFLIFCEANDCFDVITFSITLYRFVRSTLGLHHLSLKYQMKQFFETISLPTYHSVKYCQNRFNLTGGEPRFDKSATFWPLDTTAFSLTHLYNVLLIADDFTS